MKLTGLNYLVKEGVKNVWHNRIMSIASVCVLISCLVLTGSAFLISLNVAHIVDSVGDKNETTVYLKTNVSSVEAVYIGKDIEKVSNVTEAKFYSKEEGFKNYKEKLGKVVFDDMKNENPLPDAYKIKMKDLSKYDKTVAKIMKIDGVAKVSSHSDTAKKLTSIDDLVRVLSVVVVVVLGIISLFIISNTIRATMHTRRFEISIMKSVGATDAFVRIPFIVEGMVIGLVAAILSIIAMYFLYDGLVQIVVAIIKLPALSFNFNGLFWATAGVFILAGLLIGALSGFISIRKYLKKEGNEILGW